MLLRKYGIGASTQNNFKNKYGINERTKPKFLKNHLKNLFLKISRNSPREKKLFENIKDNISFYKNIKCYRGSRHKNNYPVRGQRTHTNAKKKLFKSKTFL
jgi:small subunit ribosomal protein S13